MFRDFLKLCLWKWHYEWTGAVTLCLDGWTRSWISLWSCRFSWKLSAASDTFQFLSWSVSDIRWSLNRSDVHLHVWASLSHCVIRKHVETIRLHKLQVQGDRLPTTPCQTRPGDHESASCCLSPRFLGWGERSVTLSWTTNWQICDFRFHLINVLDYTVQFPTCWRRWSPVWSGGCLVSPVCARVFLVVSWLNKHQVTQLRERTMSCSFPG